MKKNKFLFLIFFFSFFPIGYILFHPLLWHTHDGLMHLARTAAWFKGLKEGQFPVRWAGDLNYGYGSPVLIFMYFWPYFLSSILIFLGSTLSLSFKLNVSLAYLLSGGLMFLFGEDFLRDKKKAFLIALMYQFSTFHLADFIIRGAIGELWAYSFLPLSLWGLSKIFNKEIKKGFILAVLGTTFLIFSHNSISLSFFICLIFFILIFAKRFKTIFWSFISLFLGLGISAFYWIPALWERKYTYGDFFMKELYKEHFPSLFQLFLPNIFNQKWGLVHNVPVQIGVFSLLALAISLFFLIREPQNLSTKEKKIITFSLILLGGSLFLMQPYSLFIWEKIALIRQFQFPWRLLSVTTLSTSFMGFIFLKIKFFRNFKIFLILSFLILFLSIPYWFPKEGFDQIDESYWWNYPLNTTYFGEANTIWAGNPPEKYPQQRVEIIEGRGEISNFEKKGIFQAFSLNAETPVNIVSNTLFFPGWRVFLNREEIPTQFQDPNHRGLITFRAHSGFHLVELKFTRTRDRIIAEIISLLSLLIFILFVKIIKQERKL